MEELLPGTAEEPLRGRVVRRTAFRAHRTRQFVVLADADPFRPPIMTAAIGMDDRPVALAERGARVRKHAVGQRGVGARADRPGDRKPVVAVDQGRQVRLARRDAELVYSVKSRWTLSALNLNTVGVQLEHHRRLFLCFVVWSVYFMRECLFR